MTEVMNARDRVRLAQHPSWNQPLRGWAERERMGTVMSVFTPMGANSPVVRVRFDRSRAATPDHYFAPADLVLVARASKEDV